MTAPWRSCRSWPGPPRRSCRTPCTGRFSSESLIHQEELAAVGVRARCSPWPGSRAGTRTGRCSAGSPVCVLVGGIFVANRNRAHRCRRCRRRRTATGRASGEVVSRPHCGAVEEFLLHQADEAVHRARRLVVGELGCRCRPKLVEMLAWISSRVGGHPARWRRGDRLGGRIRRSGVLTVGAQIGWRRKRRQRRNACDNRVCRFGRGPDASRCPSAGRPRAVVRGGVAVGHQSDDQRRPPRPAPGTDAPTMPADQTSRSCAGGTAVRWRGRRGPAAACLRR